MKLTLTILSAVIGLSNAVAPPNADISASSEMGQKLLSKARRLNDNNDDNEQDFTWVANMALKFQGCHTTKVWNDEANGDEDVRISNQSLVRFRLCPADYCTIDSAAGCTEGYGDYIIDMETFLQAYLEAVTQYQEYQCEYEAKYGDCICDKDGQGDDFDEDICAYECYMGKGMEYCVDRNPYQDDQQQEDDEEEWELQKVVECQQYEFNFENDNQNNQGNDGDQVAYYMGAYCASNGGSIHLGIFTDDTCTQFADSSGGRQVFSDLSYGKSLPYSSTSLVGSECLACKEPNDANENDQEDEDNVNESCEQLYQASGKCEAGLSIDYPNNYACSYMEGIKITRKVGTSVEGKASKSKTVNIFIGVSAALFVGLGAYIMHLRTKLTRAEVNLTE